jgi:hypothetical protein
MFPVLGVMRRVKPVWIEAPINERRIVKRSFENKSDKNKEAQ